MLRRTPCLRSETGLISGSTGHYSTRQSRGVWKDRVFALGVTAIWSRRHSCDSVPVFSDAGPASCRRSSRGACPEKTNCHEGRRQQRNSVHAPFKNGPPPTDWMQQWRVPVMVLNRGMKEKRASMVFPKRSDRLDAQSN